MKNEEKFKTAEERQAAFKEFCKGVCSKCKITRKQNGDSCVITWLDSEYEEPEPENDVPFIVLRDRKRDAIMLCRKDTHFPIRVSVREITTTLIELYNGQCEALNAAALAWHERMKKEGK